MHGLLSKPVAAKYSYFHRKIQGLPHYLADFLMGDSKYGFCFL